MSSPAASTAGGPAADTPGRVLLVARLNMVAVAALLVAVWLPLRPDVAQLALVTGAGCAFAGLVAGVRLPPRTWALLVAPMLVHFAVDAALGLGRALHEAGGGMWGQLPLWQLAVASGPLVALVATSAWAVESAHGRARTSAA